MLAAVASASADGDAALEAEGAMFPSATLACRPFVTSVPDGNAALDVAALTEAPILGRGWPV